MKLTTLCYIEKDENYLMIHRIKKKHDVNKDTADGFAGELAECNEGTLEWVPKTQIDRLNLWEGDRIFHYLLDEDAPFFSLKLRYQDDLLKEAVLDGKPLELLDLLREDGEPSGQVRWRTLVHLHGDWHRTSRRDRTTWNRR